ncbi:MAG TPA: hemolysin family protein [Armatimonadota bacterium]|jgi:CBS domain containing-hemolysin-like protein
MGTLQSIEWFYLGVTVVLLLLSGLFSAAEIGLLSVNRFRVHQLAEGGSSRARQLRHLLSHPSRALTVILILITTLNYTNESLMTYWLHGVRHLPEWIPFLILLLSVLILAEITPINYAAANPELVATWTAPLLTAATWLLNPVSQAIMGVANLFVRLAGGVPRPRPLVTEDEVRTIVDLEAERGVLEEEEKELIHSIFEFSDTIVREIMVPRIDITAVSVDAHIATVIDTTISHRFSRLPVYQGNIDHIVGLVHVKDMLPYELRHLTDIPVSQVIRPVTFVPETKHVSELLREFRESKKTLVIVLDEYGGTAGLVTVEDLLEEIVGEIYDEYDIEQPSIERVDERTWLVDGKLPIGEVTELIGYQLPEGEYDTVAGFLYSQFGDVPTHGERIILDGVTFVVDRLDGHRITKIRIIVPPAPPTKEETARL